MAIERVTITPDGDEVPMKGDRIVEIMRSPNPREGFWIIVEREVPDPPAYKPGDMGTATIENQYGVFITDNRGVWVKTGEALYFRPLEAKVGTVAAVPYKRVSNFVPDPVESETVARLTMEANKAAADAASALRRESRAKDALSALVQDLRAIRNAYDRYGPAVAGHLILSRRVTTSAGATMLNWVDRREAERG